MAKIKVYNNNTRKRHSSYRPKKYTKNTTYPKGKGDDDYFNIALKEEDNTYIYEKILKDNEFSQFNDYDNYKEQRNNTINIINNYHPNEEEKDNKNEKEVKVEIKKKRRKTATNNNHTKKEKEKDKEVVVKENGKVIVKSSGAKNLKELLG